MCLKKLFKNIKWYIIDLYSKAVTCQNYIIWNYQDFMFIYFFFCPYYIAENFMEFLKWIV